MTDPNKIIEYLNRKAKEQAEEDAMIQADLERQLSLQEESEERDRMSRLKREGSSAWKERILIIAGVAAVLVPVVLWILDRFFP